MSWSARSAQARARIVSAAILAVGLTGAAAIYLVNAAPVDVTEQELENTKKYLRAMETYGGKANVLASELRHWFDGLWHGRTLALTVAVLTVLVTLAYRLAVLPLPPDDDGHDPGGGDVGRS